MFLDLDRRVLRTIFVRSDIVYIMSLSSLSVWLLYNYISLDLYICFFIWTKVLLLTYLSLEVQIRDHIYLIRVFAHYAHICMLYTLMFIMDVSFWSDSECFFA